ncbi:MAG TPA: hypothetical protein VN709_13210 [Terriglobales bacterium]|nr:hypothetical protein [Terriglobales bacterium]
MATHSQALVRPLTESNEIACQALYEQQRRRIQALCQWMASDLVHARHLAFAVFVEAWRHSGDEFPAVSGDHLAERFAVRFRSLFHHDAVSDAAAPSHLGPRLVTERKRGAVPLRDAVSALPSAHRLLYLLHEREGYSPATLAGWLDLEPAQCARMIHEARAQLRQSLLPA